MSTLLTYKNHPTTFPKDLRTVDERGGRDAVVEYCTSRGIDPGCFGTPCSMCGAFVDAGKVPLCYRCIIRAQLDAPAPSTTWTTSTSSPAGASA